MQITSVCNFKWDIDLKGAALSEDDIEFIKVYSPAVYWSDDRCCHWCFDTELPSGRFLENIYPNNELTEVKALIL